MPEHNQKERQIGGSVSETSSSDNSIEHEIAQLRSEIHGVDTNIVDTQIFSPQPVISNSFTDRSETNDNYSFDKINIGDKDSGFGLQILNRRTARKKFNPF